MDKRRHPRVKARGVAGHLRSDTRAASCAVENLSAGGMFVRTAVSMPVGSPVLIDLVRPGLKRSIQVSGRVVSIAASGGALAPGLGIAFDRMPADVEYRLAELLSQLEVVTPRPTPNAAPPAPARTLTAQGLVTVDAWRGPTEIVSPAVEASRARRDQEAAATLRGEALPNDTIVANVKGLFEELSRAQAELQARDEEIAMLKDEIQRLRAERRKR